MALLSNHIYILYSGAAPESALDLQDASTEKGTPCQGWRDQGDNLNTFAQQWLISEVQGQKDVFTLRNLRSGTYLDLSDGSSKKGTKIQGWTKAIPANERNQQWRIFSVGPNFRLQNVAGQTYMDLNDGDSTPGTRVQGWTYADTRNQEWRLLRVSRAGHEIDAMVENSPHISIDFKSYLQDGVYIVLRKNVRQDIYESSGLLNTQWREDIFDCDDFAFVAKAEISKWGNDFFRADGFAILFGIMFGRNPGGAHAYNWYLNANLDDIVFFEPQTGRETADIGYQAYFGVF